MSASRLAPMPLPVPWAIAGGWAIDLASGRVTRQHADVDVALFRDDRQAIRAALAGWRVDVVRDGVPAPWAAGEHDPAVGHAWLDAGARAWLRDALRRATPAHPWAAALESDA